MRQKFMKILQILALNFSKTGFRIMKFGQIKFSFLFILFANLSTDRLISADQQQQQSSQTQQIFYPIRYKNCKSQFEVLSVAITTDCSTTDRCQFPRGSDLAIQIVFKPNRRVESLKTAIWAHLGDARGALTRFNIENENACANSNITCPVEPGQTYWYTQSVRILDEYPTAEVQVNWLLTSSPTDGGSSNLADQHGSSAVANQAQPPRVRDICVKMLAKVTEKGN